MRNASNRPHEELFARELVERLKSVQGSLALARVNPSLIKTFTIMGLYLHALKAESLAEAMSLLE
jgi:hypothetical protein